MFIEDRCAERAGQIFTAIVPNLRKLPESYLDVGCGQGAMLVEFRRRFPASQCKGLEPSPDAVDYCRRHHGIEVEVLNWNSLDGDMITGPFDLITLVHVLEHVLDPVGVLTRAAQRLSPEGMIYVEVPDLLSDRWAGKGFFHIAHIWYFHETSLRNLFQRCGLEVIAVTRGVADIWPWAIGFVGRKSVSGPLAPQDVSEVTAEFVPQLVNHLRSRDISPPSKSLLLAKKLLRLVYRGAP